MTGKKVRDITYIHYKYERNLPDRVQVAKKYLPDNFSYTIVKHDAKTDSVSFSYSPDFDESHEPTVRKSCKVSVDNKVSCREYKNNPPIYHGKYHFVGEDYKGFNLQASKDREKLWKSFPDIDYNRIGRKEYWEENVVPLLNKRGYQPEEIKIVMATGYKGGATSKNSVITRHLLCSTLPKKTKILDFGAGYKAKQTQALKKKFPKISAFDFKETMEKSIAEEPKLKNLFDEEALSKDQDLIIASNVLNVQPSKEALEHTLNEIYCSMKVDSIFFANIPRDPVKYQSGYSKLVEDVKKGIKKRFGNNLHRITTLCKEETKSFFFKVTKDSAENETKFCR